MQTDVRVTSVPQGASGRSRSVSLSLTEKRAMLKQQRSCIREVSINLKNKKDILAAMNAHLEEEEARKVATPRPKSVCATSLQGEYTPSAGERTPARRSQCDNISMDSESPSIGRRGTLKKTMKHAVGLTTKPRSTATSLDSLSQDSASMTSTESRKMRGTDKCSESATKGGTLSKIGRAVSLRRQTMNVKARSASVSSKSSEIATMAAAMNSASSETISPWTTQKKKFDFSPESKSANTGQSEDATAGESNDDADKKQQNRSSTGSGQVAGTLTRKKSLSDKFRMGINATLQHKPKEGPTQSTEAKKAEMRAVENAIGELLLQLDMHTSIVQALERQIDRAGVLFEPLARCVKSRFNTCPAFSIPDRNESCPSYCYDHNGM